MKKLFLILFAFALPAIAYISFGIYTNWKTDQEIERMYQNSTAKYRKLYQDAVEYEKLKQKSIEEETKLLKQDTYGGKTPEETLELFVQALKQKDSELASKYYLPWKQEEAKKEMEDWVESGNAQDFIATYEKNIISRKQFVSDIALYIKNSKDEKYPYRILFTQNNQTKLWKISEF